MGLLTIEAERRMLMWALSTPNDVTLLFTQPIMIRLVSSVGDEYDEGTEISGDTYIPVEGVFSQTTSVDGVEFINTQNIDFNSLDTSSPVSVDGVELWDSSSTPVRVAFANFSATQVIPANGPLNIGLGQLKVRLS